MPSSSFSRFLVLPGVLLETSRDALGISVTALGPPEGPFCPLSEKSSKASVREGPKVDLVMEVHNGIMDLELILGFRQPNSSDSADQVSSSSTTA